MCNCAVYLKLTQYCKPTMLLFIYMCVYIYRERERETKKEMQNKTTMIYHHTPIRMTKI